VVTGFAERGTFKQTTERLLSYSLDDLENQESGHAEKQESRYQRKALELSVLEIQLTKDCFLPWDIGLVHVRIPNLP
jgi:hypothetical protein